MSEVFFDKIQDILNEVDPFGIAHVDPYGAEYDIEVEELITRLEGKKLEKAEIFNITKDIFEKMFWAKDENIKKYWLIADKIFAFSQKRN